MQLYPQFTREYILNNLTVSDAIVFYNEGIRIRQQLSAIDAIGMFGMPKTDGGINISGDIEINDSMDGDSIINAYKSRQFDQNSFSDLLIGGNP